MDWIDAEVVLVALAAMLSPTTLSFSVLVLVMGDRPRRTGLWFYVGALSATLVIGIVAAFVISDVAASSTPSQPKTWVAIVDIVAAVLLIVWIVGVLRRPPDSKRLDGMVDQNEQCRELSRYRDRRCRSCTSESRWFHPACTQDHF
jgi:Sap, sulfolipid-1-addressing protein